MRALLLQCHWVTLCDLQSTSMPGHIGILALTQHNLLPKAAMCAGVQIWGVSAACRSQSCSMRGPNSLKAHPCSSSWSRCFQTR